ncbi:selenocysteine-specific translation elongation factor [Bilophila wadsworthia]|uniref:selenocysteine-specific translation elongation factor n=1 Tax=Bilophila wadsworthia TaxID=35833 RepID=UPI00242E791D|nr:selenocysteine-specific translation elongation factor [Bilophila wadsworthia]
MAIVMGTAGHIDHGKTSLVRKLTGIDCDRLEEEKRRGITIELGFAFCDLPGGGRLGIVDVPGHEKFVKNMVAGASGIDFVMLVVAADEGVMPQTREHLEICSLLGIKHGLVAVTKIDMVDPELLELAVEDISEFLKGTFLEGAPLFPVSSQTGEGVDKLRDYIVKQEKELAPRRRTDLFRLPVDRVFTLKGHGTIVTGTMISGSVKVGDALELLPKKLATRARSLQSHGESVEVAESGHRTAVNLQGLDVADVERGDVLALPGTLFPSDRWLVRLTCLGSSPRALRHRAEIHFHHEAREIAARLYFLDRDKLGPGETALCEVRLDEPLVGVFGDHCVVRAFSPLRTVAGGVVLDPISAGLRRRDATPDRVASLLGLEDASDEDRVRMQIELAGNRGANLAQLSVLTNLDSKRLDKVLQALSGKGKIFCFDREEKGYVAAGASAELAKRCLAVADAFHKKEPLKQGMARGTLLSGGTGREAWSKGIPPKLAFFVVERLLRSGELVSEGDVIRMASHTVSLKSDQAGLRDALLKAHMDGAFTPPNLKDVLEELSVDAKAAAPVLKLLCEDGSLVKVKDGLYFHGPVIQELKARMQAWFGSHDDLDPAGFKELSGGLSRKYVIPLLEYFDRERVTIRVGDKRQFRGRG